MNERLPYEEQLARQLNDLPLPDENMAWADMKRRLEEDDDRPIIPVWLRGCGLWGLLAIIVIGIVWWIVSPDKSSNKKQQTESAATIDQKENKDKNNTTRTNTKDTTYRLKNTDEKRSVDPDKTVSTNSPLDSSLTTTKGKSKTSSPKKNDVVTAKIVSRGAKTRKNSAEQKTTKTGSGKKTQNNQKENKPFENDKPGVSIPRATGAKDSTKIGEVKTGPVEGVKDSTPVTKVPATKKDSIVSNSSADSIPKLNSRPAAKTNEIKKDSSKSKAIFFSAGIGMHQLLPIAGQKLTPYNSAGRKGSLADYIPSVSARMYKNDKWFLELGFRYGAPQYTKEFVYQQVSKFDTIGSTTYATTTSAKLKKTFYHQLPLTFNYFISRDWSIGTGIVWNKFVSAVSQQDIGRRNTSTGVIDSVSNKIITEKNDSLFKKSYFQAVFETQYRWRRFSIGAKYSFGLQPYIKFTLPGGVQGEERNKSLQLFIRYELWKSKARK